MHVAGWDRFPQLHVLGSGTFGIVYLSRDLLPSSEYHNEYVAVKVVSLQRISENEIQLAMSEVAILRELDHPQILKFIDCFIDADQQLCCATEYVDGGDLASLIRDAKNASRYLDPFVVVDMARQLLEGLAYLHSQAIIHRDIKPANIYITANGSIKIGDFGVSKLVSDASPEAVTFIGTPYYICPELAHGERYSFGADIWALGVLLYELYCLKLPFFAGNILALISIIGTGQYDTRLLDHRPCSAEQKESLLKSCGADYTVKSESLGMLVSSLVKSMLVVDPANRASAQIALSTFFDVSSAPPDEEGLEPTLRSSRAESFLEMEAQQQNSARGSLTASRQSLTMYMQQIVPGVRASQQQQNAVGGLGTREDSVRMDDDIYDGETFEELDTSSQQQQQPKDSAEYSMLFCEDDRGNDPVVTIRPNLDAVAQPQQQQHRVSIDLTATPRRFSTDIPVPPFVKPSAGGADGKVFHFNDPHAVEKLLREKALRYHEKRLAVEKKAREAAEHVKQEQQRQEQLAASSSALPSNQLNIYSAFSCLQGGDSSLRPFLTSVQQSAAAAKEFAQSTLVSQRSGSRSSRSTTAFNSDDEDEDGVSGNAPLLLKLAIAKCGCAEIVVPRVKFSTSFKRVTRKVKACLANRLPDERQRLLDLTPELLRLSYVDVQGDTVLISCAADWKYVVEQAAGNGAAEALLITCGVA